MGPPDRTREQELRHAIGKAQLPLSARWLVTRLIDRADFGTAIIPERFQFARGLSDLAAWCVLPRSTLKEALRCAEYHGWVRRQRQSGGKGPGRGQVTHYSLGLGADCPASGCPCLKKEVGNRPLPATERGRNPAKKEAGASQETAGQNRVSVKGSTKGELGEGKHDDETSTLKPEYKPYSFVEIMAATGPDPWR